MTNPAGRYRNGSNSASMLPPLNDYSGMPAALRFKHGNITGCSKQLELKVEGDALLGGGVAHRAVWKPSMRSYACHIGATYAEP
jgi:hypothetical protein